MIQRAVQNFRNSRAVLVMPEDCNCDSLRGVLEKLGIALLRCEPQESDARLVDLIASADIIVVDIDTLESAAIPLLCSIAVPVIALIGHESPSRLQRVLDIEASSVLMKPIRNSGVYASLFFAVNENKRRRQLLDKVMSVQERASARRLVVKAIIHTMRTHGLNDDEAYQHLRRESMRQRITIEQLSAQLLVQKGERQHGHKTGA